MMKLLLLLSIIAIVLPTPVNLVTSTNMVEWFELMIFSNKELSGLKSWIHVIMVVLFTACTFWILFDMKAEMTRIFTKMQIDRSK
jgi:chromate transport protein ChrA